MNDAILPVDKIVLAISFWILYFDKFAQMPLADLFRQTCLTQMALPRFIVH